jgi:AcrR family transcriptional regulator
MREVPAEMAAKLRSAAASIISSFDDVQMNDIAEAAGISRTSLYYYFANKDDVLAFFLRNMLDDLATGVATAASTPGDAPTRLGAVIRAQLTHLDANPATSQLLIANLGRAAKLPDLAARIAEGFETPVKRLLIEGGEEGTLAALPDADLAAAALFGAVLVIGLRSLVLDGHIDVDGITERIAPMFWHGIAPSPDAPLPTP